MPFVEDNFTMVIMAIIFISIIPPFVEYFKARRSAPRSAEPTAEVE